MTSMTKIDTKDTVDTADTAGFSSDDFDESSVGDYDSAVEGNDAVGTKIHALEERKLLAKKEIQAVARLRIVVYLVVAAVAVLLAVSAHVFAKRDEQEDFKTQFLSSAQEVTESFYDSVSGKLGAIGTLSTTITSYAQASGSTFPNVTLPDFEVRGSYARLQAEAALMLWLPLVTGENRAGWEAYASENKHWLEDASLKEQDFIEEQDADFGLGPSKPSLQEPMTGTFSKDVFGMDGKHLDDDVGPFLPLWQMTPVVPEALNALNYNVLEIEEIREALQKTLATGEVVMGAAHEAVYRKDKNTVMRSIYDNYVSAGQYRHDAKKSERELSTTMVYPVFDSFSGGNNRSLVGVLSSDIYWGRNFANVLPLTAVGFIAVLENNLGQSFTYQIDGPDVTFLGSEDLHETKYDHMVVTEDITNKLLSNTRPENQGYGAPRFNNKYCRYILRVYPSTAQEEELQGILPVLLPVLLVVVFLFASFIFAIYDMQVERRQKIVMDRAVASSAIVSSLYPEQVRDQMHQEASSLPFTKRDRLVNGSAPIAHLYTNTTLLFADLSGFTKWSSTKSPEEVFLLLESLYQNFDKIASRRKVFKVETVGDCYVAATGLPNPQAKHALIMTRFAHDCQAKMKDVLSVLKEVLGPETGDLQFRVGLHSGPVTGGVIRGQKSRFQLFGDTMNTASRMESNGIPGKVHISSTTAHELMRLGYSKCLTERQDKITAKGKGLMTTYFVDLDMPDAQNRNSESTASATFTTYSMVTGPRQVSYDASRSMKFDTLPPQERGADRQQQRTLTTAKMITKPKTLSRPPILDSNNKLAWEC